MKLKHHRQIVDMLDGEWDLGKASTKARGKTCAWIYWFEILGESEEIVTEIINGNLIGICAYSKYSSKKHWLRKHYYSLLGWLLAHSPFIKDHQALKEYNDNYEYSPPNGKTFDGELVILIVHKDYREQGFGPKLINTTFALAKQNQLKNLQIRTDESCNYHFYEKIGCHKVWEQDVLCKNSADPKQNTSEKAFIYEKIL